MSKELVANSTLSHYRIVSKIGAGGMGEVYLAEDTRLRRKIALKVLPESLGKDTDRLRRFEQEALAASALNHPNILTIHEFGAEGKTHFLAAEFIDGETLRARLQRTALTLLDALDIAVQTAQALTAAHEAHIIHRDIKPENVMLRRDGIVKVLDFGLAKLTERQTPSNVDKEAVTRAKVTTDPGAVMGTPQYMSPEQARGQKGDARSDIFSLGVMLYEMIAGLPPFGGVNALDVISAILQKEPQPLTTHVKEIPAELQRIVSKTLRKDRDERYQTARDLLTDLKDLKEELSFAAKQARAGQIEKQETATAPVDAVPTSANAAAQTASSAKIILGEIKRHKRGVALTLLLLLAVMAAFSYFILFARRLSEPIESIAVLPFVNASGNAEIEYLSDGMTETLISSLSQLPKLNVKARSSVFRYKGKEFDLPRIAQELKVQAILTGRVAQRGEHLTLSLELVDTQTENALWSEQYNRRPSDLVTLQSEIAHDVSSKLKLKLSGADEANLTRTLTANPEAYRFYLKGRHQAAKYTEEGFRKGIEYFNQAIAVDPLYALAYDGLAYCYYASWYLPAKEGGVKGKAAARKALEIDPTLAEAHASLAAIHAWFDYDWAAAEREFRQALKLNPNHGPAHAYYGLYLAAMSRFEEASTEAKQAVGLEPLSAELNTALGIVYYYAQRYEQAAGQLNKTIEFAPNFWWAHTYLARTYQKQGKIAAAIAQLEQARLMEGATPEVLSALGYTHAVSGKSDEARKIITALKEQAKRSYVPAYGIAVIYVGLKDKDQALIYLNREYEGGFWFLNFLKVEPDLDSLRADPRFAELLHRIGLA